LTDSSELILDWNAHDAAFDGSTARVDLDDERHGRAAFDAARRTDRALTGAECHALPARTGS